MLRTAIIRSGLVAEVHILVDMVSISEDGLQALGPPAASEDDIQLTWSDPQGGLLVLSDTAQVGWAWSAAGGFVPPPATAAELTAYANMKQWALAIGGYTLTIAGTPRTFTTDTDSQTLMTGRFVRLAQPNAPATMSWQFKDGWATLSKGDFVSAAVAVADFVQATFDALELVEAAIAAGTITTTTQVDAATWPSAVASS